MAPNESHLFVSSLCNVTSLPLSSRDGVVFVHFLNLCWSCDLLSPVERCRSDILRLLTPGLKEPCSCHCYPYLMHLLLCKRPGLIIGGEESHGTLAERPWQLPDVWVKPSGPAGHQPTWQLTTNRGGSPDDTTRNRDKPFLLSPTDLPTHRIARKKCDNTHA